MYSAELQASQPWSGMLRSVESNLSTSLEKWLIILPMKVVSKKGIELCTAMSREAVSW